MDDGEIIPSAGLQKAPTGIEGFDAITRGGLPRDRTTLVIGGPGSGKTVFALQTLVNGARQWNEPGIFVAFEERSRQIIANAATFGWDLPALEKEQLFFLDARMSPDMIAVGTFDLGGMLATLEAKAREMDARRIAFDSIDVLLTLLDDPLAERRELYRIHDWLAHSEMTGIITTRAGLAEEKSSRHSFLQFMSDCVVSLTQHVDNRVAFRELRVAKYRGSGFAENEFPLVISSTGIQVGASGIAEPEYAEVSSERISTGIAHLDEMLSGGYYRGTSVLITGAPGTAKSTLASTFVEAACKRGEQTLYVSFDESAGELVRNLRSVNIDLGPYVASGLLEVYSARAEARSAEEHMLVLKTLIEEYQPSCIVIDPLSAMLKAGGTSLALNVAQRLLSLTKARSITLVGTSLSAGNEPETEASPIQISTVADTWIHVSYVAQGGERNRALTIVKSRGTKHSNQVRELILSDEGVTLTDVYTAGGEVLMGTLRWEREAQNALERERIRAEVEHRRRELELAEAEARARMEAIQRELVARRAELELMAKEEAARELGWRTHVEDIQRLRTHEGRTL